MHIDLLAHEDKLRRPSTSVKMKAEAAQVHRPRRHRIVVRTTGGVVDAIVLVHPRMVMVDIGDEEGEDQDTCPALRRPNKPRVVDRRAERRLRGERRVGIRRKAGRMVGRKAPLKKERSPQMAL